MEITATGVEENKERADSETAYNKGMDWVFIVMHFAS